MAITVVRPEQQQQTGGMQQLLSMTEALNQRKAQRREAQRTDMISFVADQAMQRGGFHNLLSLEGGEDTLQEFLTEGMGFNDEKAASMMDAIRTGATPEELEWTVRSEMHRRGLGLPGEEQEPPQSQQQQAPPPQTGPVRPDHELMVAPTEKDAAREPLMVNMSQTASPALMEVDRAKHILTQQFDKMAIKDMDNYIDGFLNANPALQEYYESEIKNPAHQSGRGQDAIKNMRINALTAAIDKAQSGAEISTAQTRMMDAGQRISDWVGDTLKSLTSEWEAARKVQDITRSHPELKKAFDERYTQAVRRGDLDPTNPQRGKYEALFNEVIAELEQTNPSLMTEVQEKLGLAEQGPPIETGNDVYKRVEGILSEVQQAVQSGEQHPYFKDGVIQNHAITRDIIKDNKHVFPNGYTTNMNPQQRDYYNGVLGKIEVEEGFYTGDEKLVTDGLLNAFNTVGTPPPEEDNIRTYGQTEAAKRQVVNKAPAAMRKIPHVRSAIDIRNMSDEDLLARRRYIDQMWEANPQFVAELLPSAASARSQLIEDRYKEALTKVSLAQERLMDAQRGAMNEADPELLQGQVALDVIIKMMSNPQLQEGMPEAFQVGQSVIINLLDSAFGTGVSSEMKKKIFSFLGGRQLTSQINVQQAQRGPVNLSGDVASILGDSRY
jgi:hypothetical protein